MNDRPIPEETLQSYDLFQAIIQQAISDLSDSSWCEHCHEVKKCRSCSPSGPFGPKTPCGEATTIGECARNWFESENFEGFCELHGLSPDYVRKLVKECKDVRCDERKEDTPEDTVGASSDDNRVTIGGPESTCG